MVEFCWHCGEREIEVGRKGLCATCHKNLYLIPAKKRIEKSVNKWARSEKGKRYFRDYQRKRFNISPKNWRK